MGAHVLAQPLARACPKCGAIAERSHLSVPWRGFDFGPPNPFEAPVQVYDKKMEALYECATHGEFGTDTESGVTEFVDPDTYVEGPNGEKLFRI
jgi:hypothetical protein